MHFPLDWDIPSLAIGKLQCSLFSSEWDACILGFDFLQRVQVVQCPSWHFVCYVDIVPTLTGSMVSIRAQSPV